MTRATVLVPTHNHHLTLPLAVTSALNQSIEDIEISIIGDGVTEATREAAEALVKLDSRVRFVDLPKGESQGEKYLDAAIRDAKSEFIFYLCDDDLLMPAHVENLLGLLSRHNFVQSKNGFFQMSGELELFPTDLGILSAIQWHLKEPNRNLVSETGTAHLKSLYLSLGDPWVPTPKGEWPDHYMWKKFFKSGKVIGATHPEMTALQFPTSEGREKLNQQERLLELERWADFIKRKEAPEIVRQLVYESTLRRLRDLPLRAFKVRLPHHQSIPVVGIRIDSLRNRISRLAYWILTRLIIKYR